VPTGVVKVFNSDKGWGFIVQEGGEEVFVHQSEIRGEGFRYLLPGEPVEFETTFDDVKHRMRARDVRPPKDRKSGTVKKFEHAKGFGFIRPDDGSSDVFFHHSNILTANRNTKTTAEQGESVQFDVEVRDNRPEAIRVKRADSRPPLLRFADMGVEEQWLAKLAGKAEEETWQHSLEPSKYTEYPILRNYVVYTFERLMHEDEASPGKKIAVGRDGNRPLSAFNTGLVTPNQEEIFALFTSKPTGVDGRAWKLAGFHTASDYAMLGKFERLPDLADYFEDPSVLLYDRRWELFVDVDHVVDDNIRRFPKELQDNKHLARQTLTAARAQTQQRVYRNYKTAVPQFYRGDVQLLLPLCLLHPNEPDLALVVSRREAVYRGDTVLTLDMAYSNARLLCRPDSEWLKP
jgi:cold shock CspA family protein